MQHKHTLDTNHRVPAALQQDTFHHVRITDIVCRKDWQVRAKLSQSTIKQYLTKYRAGGSFPPIELANVNGTLLLVDGWHRLEALRLLNAQQVEAQITVSTESEAQWNAARANFTHGLPLKSNEVMAAFKVYVSTGQHRKPSGRFKSYREIAADLSDRKAYTTIRNWMRRHFPAVYRAKKDEEPENPSQHQGGMRSAHIAAKGRLEAAMESLDAVRNEARSMSAQEKQTLARYAHQFVQDIDAAQPWEPNPDF